MAAAAASRAVSSRDFSCCSAARAETDRLRLRSSASSRAADLFMNCRVCFMVSSFLSFRPISGSSRCLVRVHLPPGGMSSTFCKFSAPLPAAAYDFTACGVFLFCFLTNCKSLLQYYSGNMVLSREFRKRACSSLRLRQHLQGRGPVQARSPNGAGLPVGGTGPCGKSPDGTLPGKWRAAS